MPTITAPGGFENDYTKDQIEAGWYAAEQYANTRGVEPGRAYLAREVGPYAAAGAFGDMYGRIIPATGRIAFAEVDIPIASYSPDDSPSTHIGSENYIG